MKKPITLCWLRRDLRLDDNAALYHALRSGHAVLPLFIFDTDILDELEDPSDKRPLFIHQEVMRLHAELGAMQSTLLVRVGKPLTVWKELLREWDVQAVFTNHDYEPYANARDAQVQELLRENGVAFYTYKDQVIFEKAEVVKDDGLPYTVFTPYSRKWRERLGPFYYKSYPTQQYFSHFLKTAALPMPHISDVGFVMTDWEQPARLASGSIIANYNHTRDFPAVAGTTRLGLHLRFGTLSVRKLLAFALPKNNVYVNELIWRDFYQMILHHFPHTATRAFRKEYDNIEWLNDEAQFAAWCAGRTGYPLVDAGMRELNATGYMHNRVRMVVASFLAKHLLIDWRWGERYFAAKLLDYDLAANVGGWQWAAGCGTDAAPYFRVFNPTLQAERFDPQQHYIRHWLPEYGTATYPAPIVPHEFARKRCLEVYKAALKG